MKKLLFIAGIVIAVIAIDLFIPRVGIEDQMTSFLRNNLYKVVHFVNLRALV